MEMPAHYPRTPNSGIADARAFRVGKSPTIHQPNRFPNALKVIAKCGVYGYAAESESRITTWAADAPDCARCAR